MDMTSGSFADVQFSVSLAMIEAALTISQQLTAGRSAGQVPPLILSAVTGGAGFAAGGFSGTAFAADDPVLMVVSVTGSPGGGDPGATQGAAILYLITATPV